MAYATFVVKIDTTKHVLRSRRCFATVTTYPCPPSPPSPLTQPIPRPPPFPASRGYSSQKLTSNSSLAASTACSALACHASTAIFLAVLARLALSDWSFSLPSTKQRQEWKHQREPSSSSPANKQKNTDKNAMIARSTEKNVPI